MNKGLVMLIERSTDQVMRILHAGIEHDRQTDGSVMIICRIAYDPTGSHPKIGPEVEGGYRLFFGEH